MAFCWNKCCEMCSNLIWTCWIQKISSQIFWALERSENCDLINWVINNGSINTRLHPMALLMLLDKHLGAYVYTLRLKMSERSAYIDQFPYRHQRAIWVSHIRTVTRLLDYRLAGNPLKVTCDGIFFGKSVLKCVLT